MTKLQMANRIMARTSTIGCKTSSREIMNLINTDISEVLSAIDTIYRIYDSINDMPEEVYDILVELRQHINKYMDLVIDDNKINLLKRVVRLINEDQSDITEEA